MTHCSSLKNARGSQSGFTLIELMIVIVIIGTFTAALANLATQYYLEKRDRELDSRLDEVRSAMGRFIADDPNEADPLLDPVRYPCPADPSATPGSATFGLEQCPTPADLVANTTANGVRIVQGNGGLVLVGSVPTSTLQIGSRNMLDPYKNRFTYAVSAAYVVEGAPANAATPPGAITVMDEVGAPDITTTAEFIIVSHGRDGAGSYTSQGVANGTACGAGTTGDNANCAWRTTNAATFRSQQSFTMGNGTGMAANYFDDAVAFTLSSGDEDQWWRATDASGLHITNNNEGGNVIMGLNGGMVGIGTDVPTAPLHVHGATDAGRLVVTGVGDALIQSSVYLSDDQGTVFDNGWAMAQMRSNLGNGQENDLVIARLNSAGPPIDFRADISIDSVTGNVGIGTATPQAMLDVVGTTRAVDTTTDCTIDNIGATRYHSDKKIMEFCSPEGDVDANGVLIPGWLPLGGGGTMGPWEDISEDIELFDINCEYMIQKDGMAHYPEKVTANTIVLQEKTYFPGDDSGYGGGIPADYTRFDYIGVHRSFKDNFPFIARPPYDFNGGPIINIDTGEQGLLYDSHIQTLRNDKAYRGITSNAKTFRRCPAPDAGEDGDGSGSGSVSTNPLAGFSCPINESVIGFGSSGEPLCAPVIAGSSTPTTPPTGGGAAPTPGPQMYQCPRYAAPSDMGGNCPSNCTGQISQSSSCGYEPADNGDSTGCAGGAQGRMTASKTCSPI